ncbi:MAG: metallophosphoesterase family protein [Prevotella sp.]|nr:metallophosphoesterase family protein [Prevotella sp.]
MMSHSSCLLILLDPDTYIYIVWAVLIVLSLVAVWVFCFSRHRWLKCILVAPLCLLWSFFLYGAYVGIGQLEVRHIELAFDDLPSAFDGYRIVQFSDAHVATLTGSRCRILENAVDSINAQQADMVVFTGDLQNKEPSEIEPFRELLSNIQAADGVYSVMGNHDYPLYVKADSCELERHIAQRRSEDDTLGWHLLVNSHCCIHRGADSIVIAGMDNDGDGKRFPQYGNIPLTLMDVGREAFVVMLEHDPSAWQRKILPQSHTQLTLSGHTHGGQVSLFGWSPADIAYTESRGLYAVDNRYIYVSAGLSGVVPFRIGTPPEIVVITLRKKK